MRDSIRCALFGHQHERVHDEECPDDCSYESCACHAWLSVWHCGACGAVEPACWRVGLLELLVILLAKLKHRAAVWRRRWSIRDIPVVDDDDPPW